MYSPSLRCEVVCQVGRVGASLLRDWQGTCPHAAAAAVQGKLAWRRVDVSTAGLWRAAGKHCGWQISGLRVKKGEGSQEEGEPGGALAAAIPLTGNLCAGAGAGKSG